jgi:energy-coupling factor transport system permease protein
VFSALLGAVIFPWLRQGRLFLYSLVLEILVINLGLLLSSLTDPGFYLIFLSYLTSLTGKFIPITFLSLAASRTSGLSQFMTLAERFKLPAPLTVAAAVTLRFTVTMLEEYRNICDSRKLRGIRTGMWGFLLGPISHAENIIVPLALRCARLSDELTVSALSRGLEYRQPSSECLWSRADAFLTAWALLSFFLVCLFLRTD